MMLMDKFIFLNRTYGEDLNIGIVADDKLPDLALAYKIAEETVGICEKIIQGLSIMDIIQLT